MIVFKVVDNTVDLQLNGDISQLTTDMLDAIYSTANRINDKTPHAGDAFKYAIGKILLEHPELAPTGSIVIDRKAMRGGGADGQRT